MEQNDYWERFWASGKIDDYMNYVKASSLTTDSTIEEDENQSNEGASDRVS